MNLPGVSPSCLALDGNANGYFGIPLNCNSEARRGSDLSPFEMESPLFEENRTQNCSGSRKSSACHIPHQCGPRKEGNDSRLIYGNEKGASQSRLTLKEPLTSKGVEAPYSSLKKTYSAENVPLTSTVSNDKSLHSRKEGSTNTVPATSASSK